MTNKIEKKTITNNLLENSSSFSILYNVLLQAPPLIHLIWSWIFLNRFLQIRGRAFALSHLKITNKSKKKQTKKQSSSSCRCFFIPTFSNETDIIFIHPNAQRR
jgi:hypothetical protein